MAIEESHAKSRKLPFLPSDICLREANGCVELARDDIEVKIRGGNPADIHRFLTNIDGTRRLDEVFIPPSVGAQTATTLLQQLIDANMILLAPGRESPLLNSADFAKTCRAIFPQWKRRLFGHSLWRRLADGSASRNQFIGWLLENYHFIEGVTIRMSVVIAHCRHAGMRKHFVKHFAEEFDHHHFFMRSLKALGLSEAEVFAQPPLPGTTAVLNHMRDCGRSDPLCYAACSAFLESTGADRGAAKQFFAQLLGHYDNRGGEVINPMIDHVGLDEDYGHAGFLEKLCNEVPHIEVSRADAALQAALTLVETLEFWATDIERHYAVQSPIMAPEAPRLYRGLQRGAQVNA